MVKLDVKSILIEGFKFPIESFVSLLRRCGVAFVFYILLAQLSVLLVFDAAKSNLLDSERVVELGSYLNVVLLSLFLGTLFSKVNMLVGFIQVVSAHPDSRRHLTIGQKEVKVFLFLLLVGFIDSVLDGWGPQTAKLAIDFWIAGAIDPWNFFGAFLWFSGWLLYVFVATRLIPIWSSIALENRTAMRNAWYASKSHMWPIILIGVAYFSVVLAVRLPALVLQYSVIAEIAFGNYEPSSREFLQEQIAERIENLIWMKFLYLPVNCFLMFVGFFILAQIGLKLSGSDDLVTAAYNSFQNSQYVDHSAA